MKPVLSFQIIDHGIDHAQYFQGCGISYTDFEDVSTGCGDNPKEALDDALDGLAQSDWDTSTIDASEDAKPFQVEKPSASDLLRKQLEIEHPREDGEEAEDYEARIDDALSETESELYYYVSVRVSSK